MKYYIKQGDCLELMKGIPDNSIDMVLCDLPYGTTHNKWDTILNLDEIWKEYERITKANGAIVLFGAEPFSSTLRTSNKSMYKYDWLWRKTSPTNHLNSRKMPMRIYENICVFYKKQPTYNPQKRLGFKPYKSISGSHSTNYGEQRAAISSSDGSRYPIDIIQFSKDKSKLHPTQKPVSLLEYLIKTYTNEGDTILDNTMGSGSTGVACINTNRNFIGYELDDRYFNIAKERLEDTEQSEQTSLL